MTAEPFATPTTAQPSPGLAVGEGHFYSDGFRPGDLKYAYGVLAQLLQQNPGWQLADGTVTLQDGSVPPDLRDKFIIGAGGALALGATGGSGNLSAHTHAFTQPNNHSFTQPTGHTDHALGHNHDSTAVAAHSNHTGNQVEVTTGVGSGFWVNVYTSAANAIAGLAHTGHTVTQPAGHTDPLTHLNNHSGGAVDAHAGGAVGAVTGAVAALPPYAALYLLIKVY